MPLDALLGIPAAIESLTNISDKRFAKRVNENLARVIFWDDGVKENLLKLACHMSSPSDLAELDLKLRKTSDQVKAAQTFFGTIGLGLLRFLVQKLRCR